MTLQVTCPRCGKVIKRIHLSESVWWRRVKCWDCGELIFLVEDRPGQTIITIQPEDKAANV